MDIEDRVMDTITINIIQQRQRLAYFKEKKREEVTNRCGTIIQYAEFSNQLQMCESIFATKLTVEFGMVSKSAMHLTKRQQRPRRVRGT